MSEELGFFVIIEGEVSVTIVLANGYEMVFPKSNGFSHDNI